MKKCKDICFYKAYNMSMKSCNWDFGRGSGQVIKSENKDLSIINFPENSSPMCNNGCLWSTFLKTPQTPAFLRQELSLCHMTILFPSCWQQMLWKTRAQCLTYSTPQKYSGGSHKRTEGKYAMSFGLQSFLNSARMLAHLGNNRRPICHAPNWKKESQPSISHFWFWRGAN